MAPRSVILFLLVLPHLAADRPTATDSAGPATIPAVITPAAPVSAAMAPATTSSSVHTAAAGPKTPSFEGLLDLEGRPANPLKNPDAKMTVLLFVRTDCPISNRYAPEVRRLREAFASRRVVFWVIYPDPDETVGAIKKHLDDYKFGAAALRDTRHALVEATGVGVTPEAAVFQGSAMIYRGRIDDRHTDLGKMRPEPTTHDLEDAVRAALAGEKVSRRTRAVGCDIPELP